MDKSRVPVHWEADTYSRLTDSAMARQGDLVEERDGRIVSRVECLVSA